MLVRKCEKEREREKEIAEGKRRRNENFSLKRVGNEMKMKCQTNRHGFKNTTSIII